MYKNNELEKIKEQNVSVPYVAHFLSVQLKLTPRSIIKK